MSRRVSISDHDQWRRSLVPSTEDAERDDLDIHLAEHPPAQRPRREVNRVLEILDELNREDDTR